MIVLYINPNNIRVLGDGRVIKYDCVSSEAPIFSDYQTFKIEISQLVFITRSPIINDSEGYMSFLVKSVVV